MKVALVNANPAVSRLATLSLSKMGCEYVEVASLDLLDDKPFDVLIVDSDVDVSGTDLKNIADKILYLASKNSPEFSGADRILFKPFLPTEFVLVMEKLSPKQEQVEDEFEDLKELDEASYESDFKSEFEDEIFDDELPELDRIEDGELDLNDLSLDEDGGFEDEVAKETQKIDNGLTEEISELVKSIDDMHETFEDENLSEAEHTMQVEMLAREEELLKEFSFSDETLEQEDDSKTKEEASEEEVDELVSERASSTYDEELDVIESIKNDIDEIENLDAKFEEELQEETKDFVVEEEFAKDDVQNFAQELELPDELPGEFDDEKFDIKDEAEFEIKEQNLSSVIKNENTASEAGKKDFEIYESDATSYDDIEQISEEQMKRALEESLDEVVLKRSEVDIKTELTNKISDHIATSLSASSIKEALKGMNIKINITFEEK
ncbi:hypothetical protein [Campylobacter sp.]|uniref:hypothetical protein n=1 Tax=Campylobacter sp. TaxID=205 RepID=UPI0027024B01|nr:hypothetical protein [Campylobacter sp.]